MLASPLRAPVATDALSSPGMMDMGVAVLSLKVVTAAGPRNWDLSHPSFGVPAMLQPVEMLREDSAIGFSRRVRPFVR